MVKHAPPPPSLGVDVAEEVLESDEYQRPAPTSGHGRTIFVKPTHTNSMKPFSSSSSATAASSKKRNHSATAPSAAFFKSKKLFFRNKIRSVMRAFVNFLVSDAFMYGPLVNPSFSLSSPRLIRRKLCVPSTVARNILSTPSELVDRDDQTVSMLAPSESPVTPSSATPSSGLHSVSTLSRKVVYKSCGGNNLSKAHEETPTSASYFLRRFNNKNARTLPEMIYSSPRDESTFAAVIDGSFPGSQPTDKDYTPLHKDSSIEVARKLVKKVGGRFSKDLGIYVESHDAEVERWFLATTFLTNSSDIEKTKRLFKNLQIMGISRIQDVLVVNRSELQEAFETLIQDKRRACQLLKIANAMPTGVSSLKHTSSYVELERELESLPGYNKQAAQLFLREMKGVWKSATPEVDTGAKQAAKHLHLIPEVDEAEETSYLLTLAQDAGLDERDFEAALCKLNTQHSPQYRSCIGGADCVFIKTIRSILIA